MMKDVEETAKCGEDRYCNDGRVLRRFFAAAVAFRTKEGERDGVGAFNRGRWW